jgi:alpha-tubulin suppressor-like RCC1 family protein
VRADGSVWAWPHALYRVPAGGAVDPSLLPAPVPGLTDVMALAAGSSFTLALRADGTVLSWGSNLSGVLGRETDVLDNPIPAPVPGLTDVVSISAGVLHSVAVRADGSVWTWGRNEYGQMGDGISPMHTTPARVLLPCRLTGLPSRDDRDAHPQRCGQ